MEEVFLPDKILSRREQLELLEEEYWLLEAENKMLHEWFDILLSVVQDYAEAEHEREHIIATGVINHFPARIVQR